MASKSTPDYASPKVAQDSSNLDLLDLLNIHNPAKGGTTCVGFAPSMNRRCQVSICGQEKRLVDLVERRNEISAIALKHKLLQVADSYLCPHHWDQSGNIVNGWTKCLEQVKPERKTKEEPPSSTTTFSPYTQPVFNFNFPTPIPSDGSSYFNSTEKVFTSPRATRYCEEKESSPLAQRIHDLEKEKRASSSRVSNQEDIIKNLEARLLSLELRETRKGDGKERPVKKEKGHGVPGYWQDESQFEDDDEAWQYED